MTTVDKKGKKYTDPARAAKVTNELLNTAEYYGFNLESLASAGGIDMTQRFVKNISYDMNQPGAANAAFRATMRGFEFGSQDVFNLYRTALPKLEAFQTEGGDGADLALQKMLGMSEDQQFDYLSQVIAAK